MTTDFALSSRQRLMLTLADDLNVQGWNQHNKIWTLTGTPTDEWISFLSEFSGPPEKHLADLLSKRFKPEGHGLLVATEGWDYPVEVKAQLKDTAALRALWVKTPPDKHPQRVEIRHLLLACQDGEVIGLTVSNESVPMIRWARVDADAPSPTGDAVIDTARAVLGINEELAQRVDQVSQLDQLASIVNIATALDKAMSGQYSEEEVTRDLFLALPDSMRRQVVADMPDDIKEIVRGVLTEEECRRYGL